MTTTTSVTGKERLMERMNHLELRDQVKQEAIGRIETALNSLGVRHFKVRDNTRTECDRQRLYSPVMLIVQTPTPLPEEIQKKVLEETQKGVSVAGEYVKISVIFQTDPSKATEQGIREKVHAVTKTGSLSPEDRKAMRQYDRAREQHLHLARTITRDDNGNPGLYMPKGERFTDSV